MAIDYEGDGFSFSASEWWDGDGIWHEGPPDYSDLESGDVSGMTGHITYDDGTERYFDIDMEDYVEMGWDESEFISEIDDAADRYSEAS